jgi:protein CpxP
MSTVSKRGWIIAGVATGVLVMLGGAAAYARNAGWHSRGPMSAELISDHAALGVKYALSDVDATAEQKAQVTKIMQSAATEVHGLADQHFAARKQFHEILTAPTIDRERLEAVRASELRLADEASKRILQGVADAAEVLTPEQRTALAEHIEEHRHWRHGAR